MSKIQWLLNDSPSLPVSTLRVDPGILDGDVFDLKRKFDVLRDDIWMEFDIIVGFEIEIDSYTGIPTINVVQ